MNRIFAGLLAGFVFVSPAFADSTINNLGAGAAVQSTDAFPAYQGANPATKVTAAQLKTFSSTVGQRTNTTTSDTLTSADFGNLVYENSASAVAVTWGSTFAANSYLTVCNINAGVATITPFSGTIGGAASFALQGGSALFPNCVQFVSDGTNYSIASAAFGTGGATTTIAAGSTALGTSAIGSAACATVVTATATGTLTTDVVTASFNGDPTAVTGYIPATAGMLTIFIYPTANTFNAKVCNNTTSSITPGAITLNWRVVR